MKKILLLSSAVIVLFSASSFIISSNGIAGRTGSPGEGTCAGCHSGGAGTTNVAINSTPAFTGNQYVPGQTYTISIDVAHATLTKFGFGCEILNGSNSDAGTMQNPGTGVAFQNSGARKNAIQTSTKSGSGSVSFTFEWVAPASGNATIYAAGNAVNGNNTTSGDKGANVSLALTALSTGLNENLTASEIKIFPNPSAEELNIHFNLNRESEVKLALFDLNGKEVLKIEEGKKSAGLHEKNYQFESGLAKGIYILKFYINDQLSTQKLIIR